MKAAREGGANLSHLLAMFDQVRIINLVDRLDRRREVAKQIDRAGGMAPNIAFYPAERPTDPGEFPSLGARGCFESHLNVLRAARDAGAANVLIIEDDFDFTAVGLSAAPAMFKALAGEDWAFFYGACQVDTTGRDGLVKLDSTETIVTTPFVAFNGALLPTLVTFLEDMARRPAGSPDFGPMHVDGAYAVFRRLHPHFACWAAFPQLGRQRSSLSDITPTASMLDRLPITRGLAQGLRRLRNAVGR